MLDAKSGNQRTQPNWITNRTDDELVAAVTVSELAIGRAACRARPPTHADRQAEDGIRDGHVTGVQTCALPILGGQRQPEKGTYSERNGPCSQNQPSI